MIHNGYIKLPRSLLDWRWYKDANTRALFIHLLLKANFIEAEFENRTIKRGQVVTSLTHLSEDLNLSVKQIRTALNHLKGTGEVATETTSKYSIITINNYDELLSGADERAGIGQALDRDWAGVGQQYNKNNKEKNNKNDNNLLREAEVVAQLFESICVSFPKPIVSEIAKVIPDKDIDYKSLFLKAEQSDFLTGRNGKAGRRFNAEWIIIHADKVNSGYYDSAETKKKDPYAIDCDELQKRDCFGQYKQGVDYF